MTLPSEEEVVDDEPTDDTEERADGDVEDGTKALAAAVLE